MINKYNERGRPLITWKKKHETSQNEANKQTLWTLEFITLVEMGKPQLPYNIEKSEEIAINKKL